VPAGGPHKVVVRLAGENITLVDVMFGDVWVCSGQSNMQFQMAQVCGTYL